MTKNNLNSNYIKIKTSNLKLILEKKNCTEFIKKIKIIETHTIFLTGIPHYISIEELKKPIFLGQYGNILKIIECKTKIDSIKKTYSVFITFDNYISSALAINCLNNFKFKNKVMKCSFSSNKICIKNLLTNQCLNKNCFYFHNQINKHNSITKLLDTTNKVIMDHFFNISTKILSSNINFLKKKNTKEIKNLIFPSVSKFLDKFWDINNTRVSLNTINILNPNNEICSLNNL